MDTKQQPGKNNGTNRRKLLVLISSWMLTFVLGVALCLGILFGTSLVAGPYGEREDMLISKIFMVYGFVSVVILLFILILLHKVRDKKFFKYMSWAVIGGVSINLMVLALGIVSGAVIARDIDTCTTLDDQLQKVQLATIPITTDKGQGTAFAVTNEGDLLTAYHVVEGANEVYANYVSGRIPITVLAKAPEYDLALLKIEKPLGASVNLSDRYELSNTLYGMGYPGNTYSAGQASLSTGILSRVITNEDLKLNDKKSPNGLEVIQTDAALNPGNSGGALFNECGVVGVISSKSDSKELSQYGLVSEEGISFAISSKTAAKRFNLELK